VVVLTEHVFGIRTETVNSTYVALILSDLKTASDILTVTANTTLLRPFPCEDKFKYFDESVISVEINIGVLYAISTGSPPSNTTYSLTPFAKAPDGKVFRGAPTNVVLANSTFGTPIPLSPVMIPHPIQGNYFVGYEIALVSGPIANPNVVYNFFATIRNNPV